MPLRQAAPVPRTVLITGAATRIGKSLALAFARDGWDVAIHYRNSRAEAVAAKREVERLGVKACLVQGDLAKPEHVADIVSRAAADLGPIGALINNASMFERDDLKSLTLDGFERQIATNLTSPLRLIQAFEAQLPAENDGVVINIIDQRVFAPTGEFLSYTLSKMALLDLTKILALDLAPRIRVNGIGPGPTLRNVNQSEEAFLYQAQSVPLQAGSPPNEVTEAALYLAKASAVTGQMIAVDGGQHLWWAPPNELTPTE